MAIRSLEGKQAIDLEVDDSALDYTRSIGFHLAAAYESIKNCRWSKQIGSWITLPGQKNCAVMSWLDFDRGEQKRLSQCRFKAKLCKIEPWQEMAKKPTL